MKICVCAKQVPDTNEVKIDPVKGTLIRTGVPSILNPDDANALEAALCLKDKYPDTKVYVVSMGPAQADYMLRECLAMGADEGILISDRAVGGSDTQATSNALVATIKKAEKERKKSWEYKEQRSEQTGKIGYILLSFDLDSFNVKFKNQEELNNKIQSINDVFEDLPQWG